MAIGTTELTVQEVIAQSHIVVSELERLLANTKSLRNQNSQYESQRGVVEMLPGTLRNNEAYIMQIASKISCLQDQLAMLKNKFLGDRRQVIFWPYVSKRYLKWNLENWLFDLSENKQISRVGLWERAA